MSSICSKNDFHAAKRTLQHAHVWDFFIFPAIHWSPKGLAIRTLIERANLRAENVLFIDDNIGNLKEAQFYSPGLMCINNVECLEQHLKQPCLVGKPDPEFTRLCYYKNLEKRNEQKQLLEVSNIDFLRQSSIEIDVSYDVEDHWHRIVDLLNRTNQLNYTKNRVETDVAIAKLREQLTAFGFKAGVVSVRDRYGDYGIVGFFLTLATLHVYELRHFAFSCRVLNMGIEQYVYEFLNEPDLKVVPPVSNPVKVFDEVDWINQKETHSSLSTLRNHKLEMAGTRWRGQSISNGDGGDSGREYLHLTPYRFTGGKEHAPRMQTGNRWRA
jgi:FkbH-like protein